MTKPLAVVSNYLALIAALRARVLELGISFDTVDTIAGWADGYTSKVLAPEPSVGSKTKRAMGPMSFDAMLGTLAVKLAVLPDPPSYPTSSATATSYIACKRRHCMPQASTTMLCSGKPWK
jgi:hypothetical protein